MARKHRKTTKCLNCGARISEANYCSHCGQLNTNKQVTLKHFLQDFLGDYFTFDSKFFRSFLPLIGKPGFLTEEYNSGRRAHYILPLRLYIFTTFFFFLIITLNNKIEDLGKDQLDNIETVANQDSLYQFMSVYHSNLPEEEKSKIAKNLYSHFEITYLNNRNSATLLDTLKTIIRTYSEASPDSVIKKMARELFIRFKFRDKTKPNKESNIDNLNEIIAQYSEHIDSNSREMIAATIDSAYQIKTVLRKTEVNNITIFNQDSEEEDSKFGNFLESKVKKIIRRGDDGETQFLTEMVNQIPKVLFLLMPIFALLMKLFYIRHKILYINHLIFALHLHTIFFIYLLIPIIFSNGYVVLAVMIAMWFHVLLSFRNVYKQKFFKTFVKMNSIMLIYTFVLFGGIVLILFLAIVSS